MQPEKISVGWVDPGYNIGEFSASMAAATRDMEYFGCMGKVHRQSSALPMRSKNALIETFLKEDDAEWLWYVDDDMVFDKGHVMKLWECASEHGASIVSGLAFIFKHVGNPVPSFYIPGKDVPGFHDEDVVQHKAWVPAEPIPVLATGLASVLIHRRVFETMPADFHETYRWFHTHKEDYKGELYGEDIQFFLRANKLGFKHMLEPRAHTWHGKIIGVGYEDWLKAWGDQADVSQHGPLGS